MKLASLRMLAARATIGLFVISGLANGQTLGTIERLDARFGSLVPKDAVVERIAEGFDWSEGPLWDKANARLLFSDVPKNVVFQWKAGAGVSIFLKPSGYTGATPRGGEPGSNGLLFDSLGRLVLCQHGDRRVAILEPAGTFKTLVDNFEGKRFNSPNDGVFHSNGDLFSPIPHTDSKGTTLIRRKRCHSTASIASRPRTAVCHS